MDSTDGPLDSVMIGCPAGHWFNGPLEFLTLKNGEDRAREDIPAAASVAAQ
jgi:hypothetical protein